MRAAGRWAILLVVLVVLGLLAGCSQEQVDRAQASMREARELFARIEQAEAIAKFALSDAKRVAAELDDVRGTKLVEQAEEALAQASQGVQVAREAMNRAEAAATAATKAHEAGGGTLAVLGAALLAGVGGWAGAAALLGKAVAKYRKALELTAAHGDDMERAETNEEALQVLARSRQAQMAAGVRDLIQAARGKA